MFLVWSISYTGHLVNNHTDFPTQSHDKFNSFCEQWASICHWLQYSIHLLGQIRNLPILPIPKINTEYPYGLTVLGLITMLLLTLLSFKICFQVCPYFTYDFRNHAMLQIQSNCLMSLGVKVAYSSTLKISRSPLPFLFYQIVCSCFDNYLKVYF